MASLDLRHVEDSITLLCTARLYLVDLAGGSPGPSPSHQSADPLTISRAHCKRKAAWCNLENSQSDPGDADSKGVGNVGSERQRAAETEGTQLREASAINRSLSALGLVINKLVSGQTHIPYRDSKLTFLLQVPGFRSQLPHLMTSHHCHVPAA